MKTLHNSAEVAIIGAGPLGIELAIALKQCAISYLHFEKGQAGQMIYNFPPQTQFFSSNERIALAGIPLQTGNQQKSSREEYLAYLRSVISQHQLYIHSYEQVVAIEKQTNSSAFKLSTQSSHGNHTYFANYLVMATGGTSRPKLLSVKGEELPHVSTKLLDPHCYFQRKVVIIGGRNSAAETALRCFHVGAKVALVTRGEELKDIKYWLLPELQGCIHKGFINHYPLTEVVEITSEYVRLQKKGEPSSFSLPCDFVIKAIGFEADQRLLKLLGVPFLEEANRPLFNEESMETPIDGVFVLGTVVGGTQMRYQFFIENCHVHVEKITKTLCRLLGKSFDSSFVAKKTTNFSLSNLEE